MAIRKVIPRSLDSTAASANLNFDAGTLFVDSTNNRVGINQTSPALPLHVSASTENLALFQNSNNSPALVRFREPATTQDPYIAAYGNAMAFGRYGGSETMRIDASGNLLVGANTNPSSLYKIIGAGTDNNNLIGSYNTASGNAGIRIQANQAGLYLQGSGTVDPLYITNTSATGYISFRPASDTERMRITSAGDVGIGTSSPTGVKLSVFSGGAGTSGQLKLGYDATAFWQIGRLDPAGTGSGNFQFKPDGGATVFDITAAGNVGIGTNSPVTRLHVSSSNNSAGATGGGTEILRIANTRVNTGSGSAAISLWTNEISGSNQYVRAHIAAEYDGTSNVNGRLIFATANSGGGISERMRIRGNGNVGIGITDPQDTLHVDGTIRVSGTNAQAIYVYGAATIKPYVTINEFGVNNYYLGAGSTAAGVFSINAVLASSGGIHIKATNQYVGIGTSTPGRVLDVNGDCTLNGNIFGLASLYLGPSTGATNSIITPSTSPDSHAAAAAGTTLRLGGSAYMGVTWYRFNSSFNAGYLTFGTHIGGVFAGERAQLDVYGSFNPAQDGGGSIGNSGARWGAVYASNGTIQTSDLREKTEIVNSSLGLNFIKSLRPVSYKWKVGGIDVRTDFDAGKDEKGDYTQIVTDIAGKRTHFGLIAQEVKEVLGEQDFGGYVYDTKTDRYALRYDQFVSPLIKAVQELSQQVTQLTQRIAELENK